MRVLSPYIITVDKLAKVENINNSLIEISKHYGLPVNSLEILNKSEVTEKLTDILKERVYNYYKRDFQLFDYPR